MGETFYIHDSHRFSGIIFHSPDTAAVYTGLEVHTEED